MAQVTEEQGNLDNVNIGVFRSSSTVKGGRRFSFAAMVVVGNLAESRHSAGHSGITTEVAAIVMFAVGDPVEQDFVAATGVDLISVGWITHSAPALDVALDFEP